VDDWENQLLLYFLHRLASAIREKNREQPWSGIFHT
jgi:hypothetical protein